MRMKATFQLPKFNLGQYKKLLADQMTEAITKAAFEYVQATTALIPVWSGASLATFLQLSREIGFQLTIPQSPTGPNRVAYGQRHGGGSFEADANAGKFSFSYETDLKHLVYNEFNNANITPDPGLFFRLLNPGPYNFQEAGRKAVLRSLQDVELPDPRPFVKVKTKRVG